MASPGLDFGTCVHELWVVLAPAQNFNRRINDLDSNFAFLFKSRVKLLESFLESLIGLSSSEKVRMAVYRELVGWGELSVVEQLRSRTFTVDERSVSES